MIQRFHTNTSQNSLANVNEHSFELDNHYLSSAPLAHSTEGAATYIPFHLPPPPPSPTPAHKEFVERQKQHYRRRTQYQSPGSPSPSFYPDSPPPIMPNAVLSPSRSHTGTRSRSRTITFAGNGHPASEIDASGARGNNEPAVEFDSNNIRFVPPLNPFMTPSAVLLWNDPKLSPVHGSIITNASSTPTTPPDMSYFPSTSTTLVESLPATPITSSKKKPRLISSRPRLGSATSEGYGEKDNFTQIAQPVYGKENGGEEKRNRI
ncbi:hypothetical protein BDZ97DRAFT_1329591 [Flammula alnicola]|nr:hypothetical protein BDZ97DRAFT_1329591 [Flammula alnicola]